MIGGVLVERSVKEVLPALEQNNEQVSKFMLRPSRDYLPFICQQILQNSFADNETN
jgi:hypothetical protein